MKLCRYDEDKLGLVIGDMVHDVTAAQTQIRNGAKVKTERERGWPCSRSSPLPPQDQGFLPAPSLR
jgi:hypothetical protein